MKENTGSRRLKKKAVDCFFGLFFAKRRCRKKPKKMVKKKNTMLVSVKKQNYLFWLFQKKVGKN
jgi:transposase